MESFLREVKLLEAHDLASRLWNADETGFCTAVVSQRVLARRGSREVHETGGRSGRDYTTVLGAGSVDGVRLSPYILYKGVNLYLRWTTSGPAGTLYGVSKSGWTESNNFLEWFNKIFLPAVDHLLSTGAVVLFLYGHAPLPSVTLTHSYHKGERCSPLLSSSSYHPHPPASRYRGVWAHQANMEEDPKGTQA